MMEKDFSDRIGWQILEICHTDAGREIYQGEIRSVGIEIDRIHLSLAWRVHWSASKQKWKKARGLELVLNFEEAEAQKKFTLIPESDPRFLKRKNRWRRLGDRLSPRMFPRFR